MHKHVLARSIIRFINMNLEKCLDYKLKQTFWIKCWTQSQKTHFLVLKIHQNVILLSLDDNFDDIWQQHTTWLYHATYLETRLVTFPEGCAVRITTAQSQRMLSSIKTKHKHEAGSSKMPQNREPRRTRHMKLVRDRRQLVNFQMRASRKRCFHPANEINLWRVNTFLEQENIYDNRILKRYW